MHSLSMWDCMCVTWGHSSGTRTSRLRPRMGLSPVTISQITMPKEKQSDGKEHLCPAGSSSNQMLKVKVCLE